MFDSVQVLRNAALVRAKCSAVLFQLSPKSSRKASLRKALEVPPLGEQRLELTWADELSRVELSGLLRRDPVNFI